MVDPLDAKGASVLSRMGFDGFIFMAPAVVSFMTAVNAESPVRQLDVACMVSCYPLVNTFEDEICADANCDYRDAD
jgi:hypothetical protein